ncbi:MAG TPA: ATP-grasp domain-containing protein [Gammaproteobacteria bacterium]|jgi:D-alanine-D-alanine ligase
MSGKVAVLHDAAAANGAADAADVLAEAAYVSRGLESLGYEPVIVPVGLDLEGLQSTLLSLEPRVAFNLVESLAGRGDLIHVVPALLESLQMPFTGCSALAQWMTSNKLTAKRRLADNAIATPEILPSGEASRARGPWIVKSVWEHASLGLDDDSVVADSGSVSAVIARREREHGGQWFAERFVPGRELNVAILAGDPSPSVLPVAEIRFERFPAGKPHIVGYAAKWDSTSAEYAGTVRSFAVEPAIRAAAAGIALECWKLFELGGYARVDIRVDDEGRLWVLEINANPCLSPDAGFAAMLEAARIPFGDALARLIADAT